MLWRRFPASAASAAIARTNTLAGGRYSFVLPRRLGQRPIASGTATARGLVEPGCVAEYVRPPVTLASTATFAVAGDVETFSGQLEPGLRRRAGIAPAPRRPTLGDDVRLARARRADGSFAAAHKFTTGRTEQWRAVVPASIRNLAVVLDHVKIKIAPADWDPQDPARRDHHAGEPLLRQLLRHVPRGRRDPGRRVRPGSGQRRLRGPVPRPLRRQLRRPPSA